MKNSKASLLIGLIACLSIAQAQAQEKPESRAGVMLGPTVMGLRGFGMLCSPQAVGFAAWQLSRVEMSVKPTKEQKEKLIELRTASTKAADRIKSACPRELPRTSPERMALMEKRIEAMLESVRIVRPAFETFYASLSAQQRMKLDGSASRRWTWKFWQRSQ